MNSFQIYALAIGANLAFSTSSMVFSHFARLYSSMWINQVKVTVAVMAFLTAMIFSGQMVSMDLTTTAILLLSGLAGLCVGDIFLFRAFAVLGAGRSLVLYSFQPLMLGLYGYFFLKQVFSVNQTLSVMCMVVCVFIFMLERNRMTGNWDIRSFMWAFLGVTLDAFGVMLTRSAYELTPGLETFQVNVVRCVGAMIGFFLISPRSYAVVTKDVMALPHRDKTLLMGAAISGCFLSLTMYLAAVKYAHVGTLTAISITGPLWVALLEALYHRKPPNIFLLAALGFFVTGFYLMVIAP